MRCFRPVVVVVLGVFLVSLGRAQEGDPVLERMRKDVFFLGGPECEGRGVTTEGIQKAADYIAKQFTQAGLKPGGHDGTFFQHFTVGGNVKLAGPSSLTLKGPQGQKIDLNLNNDFTVLGFSGPGKVTAPVVFVGHGIQAKEMNFDDYAGLDVKGKIVVLIRKVPRWGDAQMPFDGKRKDEHADLGKKQALADIHKAAAVLLVNDRTDLAKGDKLENFNTFVNLGSPSAIPALHVRRDVIDGVLRSSMGQGLEDIEKLIDGDLKPRGAALPGWSATVEAGVVRETIPVKNVVGVVDGWGPLANETIVIGAHYDHLGYGGRSSLAKDKNKKDIHHGADDNASGTTAIIELARRFGGKLPKPAPAADKSLDEVKALAAALLNQGEHAGAYHVLQGALLALKPFVSPAVRQDLEAGLKKAAGFANDADRAGELRRALDGVKLGKAEPADIVVKNRQGRRLVFIAFSAEEIGLLGSRHYCNKDPLFPLKDTAAMINLDMVGRVSTDPKTDKEKLLAWGTGTAKEFDALVEKLNPGFQFTKNPVGNGPSDHDSFFRQGIPVLFFWTGTHSDYHRPSDTPDKINVAGMRKIADFSEKVIHHLATNEKRPEFVNLAGKTMRPVGDGPRLGIMPAYEEDKPGVLVDAVSPGGPAEKGGLKKGDLIVELAGKAVTNIDTYRVVMATQRLGQNMDVMVIRDGKKLKLTVLLQ